MRLQPGLHRGVRRLRLAAGPRLPGLQRHGGGLPLLGRPPVLLRLGQQQPARRLYRQGSRRSRVYDDI